MADRNGNWNINFKTLKLPLIFILFFYGVAIWRYLATGAIFYIYNFVYLGTSLATGIFLSQALPARNVSRGRRITQLLFGIYMLGYLGFIKFENMQLEGFFFYLFSGVFAAATLHYFLAKIAGPLIFSRGWCGWACWTAMVLDLLPWKEPGGRASKLGLFRYIHFFFSLGLMSFLWFVAGMKDLFHRPLVALYWLAIGNIVYYIIGIVLAYLFKDNRAFCKYICPVPVLQKITARYSLLKVEIDANKCIDCYLCEKNCPMGIRLLKYKNEDRRVLSTECILCNTCSDVCPVNAVEVTVGFDRNQGMEYLKYSDRKLSEFISIS